MPKSDFEQDTEFKIEPRFKTQTDY